MLDVVDLDEVLAGALEHVLRRDLVRLEPVDVTLVQVDRGVAVDEPLGHGATDAGGMRHPDRLGDPEPGDF
jgi:hypothetical protein